MISKMMSMSAKKSKTKPRTIKIKNTDKNFLDFKNARFMHQIVVIYLS